MAERVFILCPPLCFLFSKVNKSAASLLKTAVIDFYDDNSLNIAKHQLLKDIKDTVTSVECPHVSERREGPNRTRLIVDDIFTLLTFVDINMLTDKLPIYVTDNPDLLPSIRIYEGDFSVVMAILAKMENRLGTHDSILAAIGSSLHTVQGNLQVLAQGLRGPSVGQQCLQPVSARPPTPCGPFAVSVHAAQSTHPMPMPVTRSAINQQLCPSFQHLLVLLLILKQLWGFPLARHP